MQGAPTTAPPELYRGELLIKPSEAAALNSRIPGYVFELVPEPKPKKARASTASTKRKESLAPATPAIASPGVASPSPTPSQTNRKRKEPSVASSSAPAVKRPRRRQDDGHPGYELWPTKRAPSAMDRCARLLALLENHKSAGPFLQPVDPSVYNYYNIIKHPMDLGTVRRNLDSGVYRTPSQFATDVRRIWTNSFRFNEKGSAIYSMTTELSDLFEQEIEEIENMPIEEPPAPARMSSVPSRYRAPDVSSDLSVLQSQIQKMSNQIASLTRGVRAPIVAEVPRARAGGRARANEKPLTRQEKADLGAYINKLQGDKLQKVVQIISDSMPIDQRGDNGSIEIDLDSLPTKKLRELDRYVKQVLGIKKKQPRKSAAMDLSQMAEQHATVTKKLSETSTQLQQLQAMQKTKPAKATKAVESDSSSSSSDSSDSDSDSDSSDSDSSEG